MNDFFCINKSNIFHIINNNKSCTKKYLNKLSKLENTSNNRLCKNCYILFIKKYKINDNIYYRYNDNIYLNLLVNLDNILLKDKLIGNIDKDGNIYINDYYINLISINKEKYYLVNNRDLYNIDNLDILNINLNSKIGKLLGPNMCIINKKMIIINNNKLKYNLWEIVI
tara:strand:- start:1313 stop:1819 length:507 start_codon:yes stop_codon:yes gene_type:complete